MSQSHFTGLAEQFLTFSHSRFPPFSKPAMQFRSRSTLPLLFQTSKPIKIACKGFHLISTTQFLVIQLEHFVPCCLVGSELPQHLLQIFFKISAANNSAVWKTATYSSPLLTSLLSSSLKCSSCLSATELFRTKSSHFYSLSNSLPLAIFPSLPVL